MGRWCDLWLEAQQEKREGVLGGVVFHFQRGGQEWLHCEAETETGLEGGLGG